jgi:multidrug efflux pump subunit AcrB
MPVAKVRLTVAVVMLLGILGTGAGFALSHALDQVGSRPRPEVSIPAPARLMQGDSPVIVVTTSYPRAGQVIAAEVVGDIEKQCKGIEGMVRFESTTQSRQYAARLYFKPGTDPASAMKLVQSRVALAEPVLPPGVVQKNKVAVKVGKAEYGPREVAIAIMDRGDKFFWGDWQELQKAASAVVKRLEAEGALTKPQVFPRVESLEFEVHPEPAKCAALGVTVTEVNQAVQKGFSPAADGKAITPKEVKEEVKKVVVRDKITLGDIGDFKDNYGTTASYRVGANPATRKVFPRVEGSGFEIWVQPAKCAALGVTLAEVKQVVEKRLGSAADGKTIAAEEVKKVVVRDKVTVRDVATFKDNYGQTADYRVDGIPAIRITGVPPEGKSVAEAAANCVELTEAELERIGSRSFAVQDLSAK